MSAVKIKAEEGKVLEKTANGRGKIRPEQIVNAFEKKFGKKFSARIETKKHKARKIVVVKMVWAKIDKSLFKEAVAFLCELYPRVHFSVASGYDLGKTIELIYHFAIGFGGSLEEFLFNLKVVLPKKDLVLESITDLIPGALISERELQEMLGVKIKGIPDSRRLFLPKEIPKGVYPLRRDSKGPEKLVRNLNEAGKK